MPNRIYIICIIALSCLVSCANGESVFVRRNELLTAQSQNDSLRNQVAELQADFVKQNENLAHILADVASLSNRSSRLRFEQPEVAMTEMQLFQEDVTAIKARIDQLEKEADAARKLRGDYAVTKKTILELRETVVNYQRQVESLKIKLEERERTITEQSTTISGQRDTIFDQKITLQKQSDELARVVQQQTDLLFRAGNQFSRIANEGDFKITGRKNKRSVNAYRREIYHEALTLYQMAALRGVDGARDSIRSVTAKIEKLSFD